MSRTERSWSAIGRMMLSALCLAPLAVLLGMAGGTRSEKALPGKHKSADAEAVSSGTRPIFVAREFYDQ
jgi:hypothetical protein